RMPLGPLATLLKGDIDTLVDRLEPSSNGQASAWHLMFVSAALCSAITAPDTNAPLLLEIGAQRLPRLERLYGLCRQITEYANVQLPLDPIALEYVDSSDNWTQQVARIREEVDEWYTKAANFQFKYPPAGKVWRKWLDEGGLIDLLVSPIRS